MHHIPNVISLPWGFSLNYNFKYTKKSEVCLVLF